MVDKFNKLLAKIKLDESKKVITLFAIAKMDDITDRWTVILCAPWASGQKTFEYMRKLIVDELSSEELSSIARLSVFDKNTSLVQGLLKYATGTSIDEETKINGNIIYSAHILESNSEV